MHRNRQQCLVAKWLGLSVTVRVRAGALSCTLAGSCDVHGVRTTTVCDVTMMYCQEWYMENEPDFGYL